MIQKITIAKGDGIGPEIMDATLAVLKAAGAALEIEEIEVGERVYLSGNTSGISQESMEVIRKNKIFLKAPITTPQGGGYKSLNVTIRKSFGLFANVRPAVSYHPFISSKHSNMDLVIIRENEEDLYAGIEHQQTDEVVQCLKLVSRPGCEKLIRYAFEFARQQGRKKVTCFTKDNIMKQTDGLFHKVFDEIGAEYEDIEKEHWIVDIGAAKMADTPEVFDVIVTLNLYGDILSDVAAQIAGSVGLAGSANIGEHCAMFEAIHGSAPRRAGQNLANPSGLLQGAVLMLQYIGQHEVAEKIQNAWLKTLEDGVLTYDVYREGMHTAKVGTKEFAEAIIARLGQVPSQLPPARFIPAPPIRLPEYQRKSPRKKVFKGFDLFLHWNKNSAEELANMVMECSTEKLALSMITNRGIKVWPNGLRETFCTDHWRCRFKPVNGVAESEDIVSVLKKAIDNHLDVIKTENLYAFDGVDAYSLGQGQ